VRVWYADIERVQIRDNRKPRVMSYLGRERQSRTEPMTILYGVSTYTCGIISEEDSLGQTKNENYRNFGAFVIDHAGIIRRTS